MQSKERQHTAGSRIYKSNTLFLEYTDYQWQEPVLDSVERRNILYSGYNKIPLWNLGIDYPESNYRSRSLGFEKRIQRMLLHRFVYRKEFGIHFPNRQ
jgi:hypothetical protein